MAGTIQSTVIRASAGSGKTFQLANRFLTLMVLGVAPEKIIALTFTRKAAGEFTSRIMTRLASGAESDVGAAQLAGQLKDIIEGTDTIPPLVKGGEVELPEMDAAFFQDKLKELIDVLDRLALSTLDSYFVRIVRNFHLELGLSGFELMEDSAISGERLGVMKLIFSSRKTSKNDRDAFIQSFKQATWGEEENRLSQTLEDFVKKHQNRWLSAPQKECWGGVDLLWPDGCPYPKGNIKELAQKLSGILGEPHSPHKRYMKGWQDACAILEAYQPGMPTKINTQLGRAIPLWDQYAQGGLIEEKNKYEISPEMGKVITDLIGAYIRSEIEIRMKRTQGLYSLISAYEERYRQNVRNKGRLCFSDLTLLLAGQGAMQMWDEDDRNLVDFRLDARYDHWLLDEFQDTSRPQWQAVANLIDEIMQDTDGQRSVFVVGDSKQSIYGWRGGEPRLFDDLKKHYGERLEEWDMDRSYRSSQPVLDLVNAVCDLTDSKWREIFPSAAIDRWAYHTHTPDEDRPGHTLVLETSLDSKGTGTEEKTEARYACMKAIIEKLRPLEHGMTCAILVSKNDQVTAIVDFLRRKLPGVPVASDSEATLADGPVGAVMLDLFRWLRNPAHHFARIHVSMSPVGQVITGLCETDHPEQQWTWLTDEIAKKGVESLVARIIPPLKEQLALQEKDAISPYGESRLDEILLVARDFSCRGGSLDDWVLMLESRSLRETTHDGLLQVMTIHKCKGLGFDMVILPELGSAKEFVDVGRLDALERKGQLGAVEYVIKKPTKEICDADPTMRSMMKAWEADQCYERFCNLYVALTRAKQATYCILDPVSENWKPRKKYDDWIREATSAHKGGEVLLATEPYNVLYESGDWLETDVGRRENLRDGQQKSSGKAWSAKLQAATPRVTRKVASEAKKYQPGVLLHKGKAMRFGDKVHRHFEKITWLDELPELPDTAVGRVVAECLDQEEIAAHFERPDGEFQLLREQAIETRDNGQWVSGVVDRAVILLENGKPSSISIIDFKTDRNETIDSLREKYKIQLGVYRAALHRITGVSPSRISCHLLATSLKKMVEL